MCALLCVCVCTCSVMIAHRNGVFASIHANTHRVGRRRGEEEEEDGHGHGRGQEKLL